MYLRGTAVKPLAAPPAEHKLAAPRRPRPFRFRAVAESSPAKARKPPGPPVQPPSKQASSPSRPRPPLRNPARFNATSTVTVAVPDRGGEFALNTYMQLPTDQYAELDPTMIQPLGGNKFRMSVPRLSFFNLWVQPIVDVDVSLVAGPPGKIIMTATSCKLGGSPLVRRMKLNDRFNLNFTTELSWQPAAAGQPSGSISGDLFCEVECEITAPFHLTPRPVLEGTCGAVLRALSRSLLPVFVRQLAADYERWAGDSTYRVRRESETGAATAAQ